MGAPLSIFRCQCLDWLAAHEAGEFCLDTLLKYTAMDQAMETHPSPHQECFTPYGSNIAIGGLCCFVFCFFKWHNPYHPMFHHCFPFRWPKRVEACLDDSFLFFSSSHGEISQIWIDSNSSFSFLLYLLVMTNIANWNMAHLQIMFPAINTHW